jgi:hypothetical protein
MWIARPDAIERDSPSTRSSSFFKSLGGFERPPKVCRTASNHAVEPVELRVAVVQPKLDSAAFERS